MSAEDPSESTGNSSGKRRALGRGLSALLPSSSPAQDSASARTRVQQDEGAQSNRVYFRDPDGIVLQLS